MPIESLSPKETLPFRSAFRHFVVFQLKLVADAVRDVLFSPISFVAFVVDSITRPSVEKSLSMKIMMLGRKSDRVINLFNEYSNNGDYTIDYTVAEVEAAMQKEMEKRRKMKDVEEG